MNEVMQNTKSFIDNASNDSERNSPPKKGHGYTGKGSGPGRAPGPTPYQQGRTVVGEGEGHTASLDGSESNAEQPQGAPYVGSLGAKGGWAKKVGYGEL